MCPSINQRSKKFRGATYTPGPGTVKRKTGTVAMNPNRKSMVCHHDFDGRHGIAGCACRRESADKSDALQTLRAQPSQRTARQRLECVRLQRRFPKQAAIRWMDGWMVSSWKA